MEKLKIIEKFGLESTPNLSWVSRRENSHEQMIFKHSYLVKNDILRILFRINKLCFAKVNYFSKNIEKFEPQIYDYENGFIETELWNAEFLKHLGSGKLIDLRYLQSITDIEIFRELCFYLESLEEVL
ncbi:MAG: hypothetical protein GY714_14465 [Desulfobacterales bacterium]|nr:hypothetical protein [Desulfobacterales bacterium]